MENIEVPCMGLIVRNQMRTAFGCSGKSKINNKTSVLSISKGNNSNSIFGFSNDIGTDVAIASCFLF